MVLLIHVSLRRICRLETLFHSVSKTRKFKYFRDCMQMHSDWRNVFGVRFSICGYYLMSSYLEIGSVVEILLQMNHWRRSPKRKLKDKAEEGMQKCVFQWSVTQASFYWENWHMHYTTEKKVLGLLWAPSVSHRLLVALEREWGTTSEASSLCKFLPISQGQDSREDCRWDNSWGRGEPGLQRWSGWTSTAFAIRTFYNSVYLTFNIFKT